MDHVLVIAEYRQGRLRDTTREILTLAKKLAKDLGNGVMVLLLGKDRQRLAEELIQYGVKVLLVDDPLYQEYDAYSYKRAIAYVIDDLRPKVLMTGQTAQGVDFMPAIAVHKRLPYIPEVVDLFMEDGQLKALRQIYSGKVNALLSFKGEGPFLVTVREGANQALEKEGQGSIEEYTIPLKEEEPKRTFVEYREAEVGDVDISQSQILVAVGRGLKEDKNLPIAEALAQAIGGDLCGSRPAIDLGWLQNDRQVGVSGKTVKPKLYLALGISGAFQHTTGMKGAKTIIAINKDNKAPIFAEADYAIVDDLFKVVPPLTEKIKDLKE